MSIAKKSILESKQKLKHTDKEVKMYFLIFTIPDFKLLSYIV